MTTKTEAAAPGRKLLSRAQLQRAVPLPFEDVDVPELGGVVRVRAMTALQREDFMESVRDKEGKLVTRGYVIKQLAICVVDDDGKPAVSEQVIQGWPATAIDRLFAVADRFTRITEAEVEAEVKNSERGQSRRFILRWAYGIGATPRELLARTTVEEMVEMMAFERLEPMSSLQSEWQAGQICAVLANLKRDEKTRPDPYVAADFMPILRDQQEKSVDADAPSTRGDDLDDDEFEALFDAVMFGRAPS